MVFCDIEFIISTKSQYFQNFNHARYLKIYVNLVKCECGWGL